MPRNFLGTLLLIVILLTGHLAQVAAWAAAFVAAGAFRTFAGGVLTTPGVNDTTLGYGDIVMSSRCTPNPDQTGTPPRGVKRRAIRDAS